MKNKYFFLTVLLLFVICSYLIGPLFPEFFTHIYNQKFYSYLDSFLHLISNIFPFSLGDVFYAVVVIYFIYRCFVLIKRKLYKDFGVFILTSVLLFFGIFQLFWGWNNFKFSVAHQLKLERSYTQAELDSITKKLTEIVNNQQFLITKDSLKEVSIDKDLELFNKTARLNYTKLPEHLKEILTDNKINNVKPSFYSYLQSYTGSSGYFNPFTHENQVNIQIPTIGMPVTVAHEMAHQLGIASETEANFYGYKVLLQSTDLKFKYAANLYALKHGLKQY